MADALEQGRVLVDATAIGRTSRHATRRDMAAPAASEMALEHAMPAVDERAVGFPCRLRSVEDAEHTLVVGLSGLRGCERLDDDVHARERGAQCSLSMTG